MIKIENWAACKSCDNIAFRVFFPTRYSTRYQNYRFRKKASEAHAIIYGQTKCVVVILPRQSIGKDKFVAYYNLRDAAIFAIHFTPAQPEG